MLMHAIAHEGCTDTVRGSALESSRWEKKIPCRTGESSLSQRRASPTFYQLGYILDSSDRINFATKNLSLALAAADVLPNLQRQRRLWCQNHCWYCLNYISSPSWNFCVSRFFGDFRIWVVSDQGKCAVSIGTIRLFIRYPENAKYPPDRNGVSCSRHKIV